MPNVAKVAQWFVSEDTVISSMTIAAFMCGVDASVLRHRSAPCDPGDLGRCLRLLEQFPRWKKRMPEMASINNHWKRAVRHWDKAAALMEEEVGIDWSKGDSASRTYAFMKQAGF